MRTAQTSLLTSALVPKKVHTMLDYIARRLLWLPILLIIVSLLVFLLGLYGPGDPVEVRLGQNYSPERAERLREQLGLNDPFWEQYFRYARNALQGDLGESFRYPGRSVTSVIGPPMWVSFQLNVAALIITLGIGTPLGFYVAKRQGRWLDPVIVTVTLLLAAIPLPITAPFLVLLFALTLDLVPASGWGGFTDSRILLPALAVGVPGIAGIVRYMRASTADVLGQDYIRTAHSKGLGQLAVNYRHIARNALVPVVTVLGFTFAGLLGGTFLGEVLFGIPGIARLALEAIGQRDYNVIMAFALIGATTLVIANLVVDIAYTVIDPRIRLRA
jgi:ABC-type dipeptide/oligopeptide/nickel transport system permease component